MNDILQYITNVVDDLVLVFLAFIVFVQGVKKAIALYEDYEVEGELSLLESGKTYHSRRWYELFSIRNGVEKVEIYLDQSEDLSLLLKIAQAYENSGIPKDNILSWTRSEWWFYGNLESEFLEEYMDDITNSSIFASSMRGDVDEYRITIKTGGSKK